MTATASPGFGDELLADLTRPQREAVAHVDGPLLVLAGPGSGKTRVITRRIAYLIREVGIAPWNVLAITFTNKAAGEMRERVASLLTERQANAATIRTFHALCALLLRLHAERLGLPPGYSIYDAADQKAAVKQALKDLEISSSNFPPATVLAQISNAKNELLDAEAFASRQGDFYGRTIAKVYRRYEAMLARNHALDFDDLLLKTVQLMRGHPEVLAELRARYQYVLVDEYQDTNHAQFCIANAIAAPGSGADGEGVGGNLCVVGDPDQSIYAWRGADIRNIMDFEGQYPGAKVIRLGQNYRSSGRILAAADALIRHNRGRKHKELFTENEAGEAIRLLTCRDERQEAEQVVDACKDWHLRDGLTWSQMAVFYRQNSLSRVLEDSLRDAGVPYQIARGTAFYDRKEIKDVIAYLRTVANPADEVNLLRVINFPTRGISKKTQEALQAFALAHMEPIHEVIGSASRVASINPRAQTAVGKFAALVENWRRMAGIVGTEAGGGSGGSGSSLRSDAGLRGGAPDAGGVGKEAVEPSLRVFVERVIRESGLHDHYARDKADPDGTRLDNLGEFVTFAQQFEEQFVAEAQETVEPGEPDRPVPLAEKLLGLLERISLVSDADAVDSSSGSVTLMTLHAAKGLEFPAVAIVGLEDGLIPHERSNDTEAELEEERRLLFVGITRAMRHLMLTLVNQRTVFGQSQMTVPSRFIRELPGGEGDADGDGDAGVLSREDVRGDYRGTGFTDAADARAQREMARDEALRFPPGTLVRHPSFGLGRVVDVMPVGASTRARIRFNTAGTKTIVLQFARGLEVVSAPEGVSPRRSGPLSDTEGEEGLGADAVGVRYDASDAQPAYDDEEGEIPPF